MVAALVRYWQGKTVRLAMQGSAIREYTVRVQQSLGFAYKDSSLVERTTHTELT